MNGLRVVCGISPAREFTHPHRIVRAHGIDEARHALDEAEQLRRDGAWIAGYLSYELGAAFAGQPPRATAWPLLVLGAFDQPNDLPMTAFDPATGGALLARTPYSAYERAIADIRASIYDGNVYQVNYTMPFALRGVSDPFAFWCAIAHRTGARYQAYVEDDARRILSWSPELFLAFDGERIETRPMKGTAPLDALEELANAKNRAEHVMIVDLLRNDLHRIASEVRVERLFELERYPTFATMTSTIAGTLPRDATLREILEATFPCGSVTGAPKRAAVAHIATLESSPRDAYCGAVGYLSPDRRGWWSVAIRTAQLDLDADTARFDAGGGIVADSDAASEWAEIHVKAAFLRSTAPFDVRETFASDATPARIERHLERLEHTAARFGVRVDRQVLRTIVRDHTLRPRPAAELIRVRASLDGSVRIETSPLETPQRAHACLATARVRRDDPFLRVKTSWRPVHDAASAEAAANGCFDAILRNERGELTEGARTNLFLECDGILLTPAAECGLLPGILRAILVSEGRAREAVLTVDDLERADAVYLGNSARGLVRMTLVKDPL